MEAEEKALDHVQRSRSPIGALSFLIDWPALDRAAALAIEQASSLEGIFDHILIPAADALAPRHPLAATLALRAMIDFAIGQRPREGKLPIPVQIKELSMVRFQLAEVNPVYTVNQVKTR